MRVQGLGYGCFVIAIPRSDNDGVMMPVKGWFAFPGRGGLEFARGKVKGQRRRERMGEYVSRGGQQAA